MDKAETTPPVNLTPTVNLMQILGVVLLLVSVGLFAWGIAYDPTFAGEAGESSLLPDRVIIPSRLATKTSILTTAGAVFISGWLVVGAGYIGSMIEKLSWKLTGSPWREPAPGEAESDAADETTVDA